MDFSEMSIEEVQQELERTRRNEQLRAWGIVAAAMVAALVLCLVLVQAVGLDATILVPVLGIVGVLGYGVAGVARGA